MARRTIDHRQTFGLEDRWLVRTVVKPDGSSYQHRCSLASYRAVAHFIDDHVIDGGTTNGLWDSVPDVTPAMATSRQMAAWTFPTARCPFQISRHETHASDCHRL